MTFKVVLTGWVDLSNITLEEVTLPFVPFKGLRLDYPTFTACVGEAITWNGDFFEVKISNGQYMKKPNPELAAAFK